LNNRISLVKPVETKDPPVNNTMRNNLVIGLSVLGFVLILMFIFIVRYIRHQKNIIDKLRDEELKLFREGNPDLDDERQGGNRAAQNLPYDENFEIDPLHT